MGSSSMNPPRGTRSSQRDESSSRTSIRTDSTYSKLSQGGASPADNASSTKLSGTKLSSEKNFGASTPPLLIIEEQQLPWAQQSYSREDTQFLNYWTGLLWKFSSTKHHAIFQITNPATIRIENPGTGISDNEIITRAAEGTIFVNREALSEFMEILGTQPSSRGMLSYMAAMKTLPLIVFEFQFQQENFLGLRNADMNLAFMIPTCESYTLAYLAEIRLLKELIAEEPQFAAARIAELDTLYGNLLYVWQDGGLARLYDFVRHKYLVPSIAEASRQQVIEYALRRIQFFKSQRIQRQSLETLAAQEKCPRHLDRLHATMACLESETVITRELQSLEKALNALQDAQAFAALRSYFVQRIREEYDSLKKSATNIIQFPTQSRDERRRAALSLVPPPRK